MRAQRGEGPEEWGGEGGAEKAQHFAFFFSPVPIFALFFLSRGSSRGIVAAGSDWLCIHRTGGSAVTSEKLGREALMNPRWSSPTPNI